MPLPPRRLIRTTTACRDDWETSKGLNPAIADHNGTALSVQGYTNLEVYLHERAAAIVTAAGRAPVITSSGFSGGRFAFSWTDVARVPVDVERRSDLGTGTWSTVSSNDMNGSFTDAPASEARAFYRLNVR